MKKIFYALLAIVFVGSSMLLSGCNENENYWQDTNLFATEFVTKEENAFLTLNETSITYSEEITQQINDNTEYTELNQYYTILKSLMLMFDKQYVNLAIIPNGEKVKSYYDDFDKNLKTMQTAITTFLEKKSAFEENLQVIENLSDASALYELKVYKKEMSTLINQTLQFNQSFENLYTNAYLSIPTADITLYQSGYENLILSVTINKILRNYITYSFNSDDNLISTNANTNALTEVERIKEKLIAGTYKENTLSIINEITNYTQMFNNEIENFNISLNAVNLPELLEDGDETYLASYPNQINYVNQINRFNNTVLTLYTNKVLELSI